MLGFICLKNLNFKAWVHHFLGLEVWILYQYWVAVLYTMDSEEGLFGPSQKSHQPIFKDKSSKLVNWLVFSKDIRKIIAPKFMSENRWETFWLDQRMEIGLGWPRTGYHTYSDTF